MLRQDINRLIDDFGVKQEAIIKTLNSNRVTFAKKMRDNSFDEKDRKSLHEKYGSLL